MSKINLTVHSTAIFATLEEARVVGQAIDILLNSADTVNGSVKLTEVPSGRSVSLVPLTYDRSKVVVGGQEAESDAQSLSKEIEKAFVISEDAVESSAFWADFISTSKNTGSVDYAALKELTAVRLGIEDGTEAVVAAAGVVASNQIARTLRPAPVKKVAPVKKKK